MKKENLKVAEEIKEAEETKEAVEQTTDKPVITDDIQGDEVEVTEEAQGLFSKAKGFAKKHWKVIAGAAAVGTAAVLVAKATKKDDVIEGEFVEVMDTFEYDKDYADREEVEEQSDTKVEEEA